MSMQQSPAKPPRTPRSERNWLDSTGAVIQDEDNFADACGFSFEHKGSGKTFTRVFDPVNHLQEILMLATFGGQTLAGNVASGKHDASGFADIEARFALFRASPPLWVERVSGPRWIPEILARAISMVATGSEASADTYLAKINGPPIKVQQQNGAMVEIEYAVFARTNPDVLRMYDQLAGKVPVVTATAGQL